MHERSDVSRLLPLVARSGHPSLLRGVRSSHIVGGETDSYAPLFSFVSVSDMVCTSLRLRRISLWLNLFRIKAWERSLEY